MQRNLVIHLSKIYPTTTTASTKIAQLLSELLQCELMERSDEEKIKDYDNVIIVNSPSAFCTFIEEIVEICQRSHRLIWVMQDYSIYPPTQLRRYLYDTNRQLELWSTLPELPFATNLLTYGNLPRTATKVFNWNALTYTPIPPEPPTKEGLIYWGAYRAFPSMPKKHDRKPLFDKYFRTKLYPITISTSNTGARKFYEEYGDDLNIVEPLSPLLIQCIQMWQGTIYIEDQFSSMIFCQPANRFYEALSAGIAMFVDSRASGTLRRAGFEVTPELGLVSSAHDIKLDAALEIAKAQKEAWTKVDHREVLLAQLREAVKELQ